MEKLLSAIWGDEPKVRGSESKAPGSGVRLWWQDLGPQSRLQLISFVNGRRVSDAVIRSAITSFNWAGRGNWLVMITLPPEDVDVNVHPAKSEILFRHSSEVYDLIHRTAEGLARGFSEIPVLPSGPENSGHWKSEAENFNVRPQQPVSAGGRVP